jgi:hypothetical protein
MSGDDIDTRYNFWSYLKVEIIYLRELIVLFCYKRQG